MIAPIVGILQETADVFAGDVVSGLFIVLVQRALSSNKQLGKNLKKLNARGQNEA